MRVLSLSWESRVWPTPLVMWLQEQQRSNSSTSYNGICQHKGTGAAEGSFGINESSPAALTKGRSIVKPNKITTQVISPPTEESRSP